MTNQISFYIVFHQRVFASNTSEFTEEQIQKYFVWMGVNAKFQKQIPDKMKDYPFVYEYNLTWYDPMYQTLNFYQNSVFFHLWKNPQILPEKYIGFAQYDMFISAEKFLPMMKELEQDNGNTLVGVYNFPQETLKAEQWQTVFLDVYNKFYNQQHTIESLRKFDYFLYHTFILPKSFFLSLMPFIDTVVPHIRKALRMDTRHLAGTLERVFAFCLAAAMKENKFDRVLILNGIHHLESQREEDTLRGIQKGNFTES
jgi:hypothetical protein